MVDDEGERQSSTLLLAVNTDRACHREALVPVPRVEKFGGRFPIGRPCFLHPPSVSAPLRRLSAE